MDHGPDPTRLKALEDRIAEAKRATAPTPRGDEHYSRANQAWRMVTELVSGLGIGFAIGYGLDLLLGTIPVFLVIMTLVGFAAGIKTMMRTANEVARDENRMAQAGQSAPVPDDEDEEN